MFRVLKGFILKNGMRFEVGQVADAKEFNEVESNDLVRDSYMVLMDKDSTATPTPPVDGSYNNEQALGREPIHNVDGQSAAGPSV